MFFKWGPECRVYALHVPNLGSIPGTSHGHRLSMITELTAEICPEHCQVWSSSLSRLLDLILSVLSTWLLKCVMHLVTENNLYNPNYVCF